MERYLLYLVWINISDKIMHSKWKEEASPKRKKKKQQEEEC